MTQLRQQQEQLNRLKIVPKIITFDSDFMAEAYVKKSGLEWPLLIDSDRKVYDAYGMSKGSFWDLYNPLSIWRYLVLMAKGTRPGKPGSDWHQLGGDVLIDPAEIVRLHHVSQNPHDRPSLKSIFDVVSDTR